MGIKAGVIYKVTNVRDLYGRATQTVLFAYSPDGEGLVWYDTLEEVQNDTGIETVIEIEDRHLEKVRGHI